MENNTFNKLLRPNRFSGFTFIRTPFHSISLFKKHQYCLNLEAIFMQKQAEIAVRGEPRLRLEGCTLTYNC